MGQDDWIELTSGEIPFAAIAAWVVRPGCGAVDIFCGTAREQSEDRQRVERLEYEAYEPFVVPKMTEIALEARRRWPVVGRLALVHRVGPVLIGEASVLIAASTPHRSESFDVVRWCIDTLKATVPIWKRETWEGGADWGLHAQELSQVADAPGPDR